MEFNDYSEVSYKELQKIINAAWDSNEDRDEMRTALKLGVKSTQSVINCLCPMKQIVSDDLLTGMIDILKIDAFIIWSKRRKRYFVKNICDNGSPNTAFKKAAVGNV